ncbi:hypothetical protein Hanom_Chr08g00756431 [Helianthus anomalus]
MTVVNGVKRERENCERERERERVWCICVSNFEEHETKDYYRKRHNYLSEM